MLSTVFFLVAIVGVTYGIPWNGAQETKQGEYFLATQNPIQPTPTPKLLHRRQNTGDLTCGYYEGFSNNALYCLSNAVCATNSFGAFGCCYSTELDNCSLPTTCIDSTATNDYASSFLQKFLVTACTDATAPLCITQIFEYDYIVTGWDCGSSDDFLTQTYYSTYENATTSQSTISVYNAYYSATTSSTKTSSSTSSSILPIPITPVITPTPVPPKPPKPIGAIVGGVIGGLALLSALGVIAFLLLRKTKGGDSQQSPHAEMQSTNKNANNPNTTQNIYPQEVQSGYRDQGNSYGETHTASSAYPVNVAAAAPSEGENLAHMNSRKVAAESHLDRLSTIAPPYSPPASPTGFPTSSVAGHEVAELSEQNRLG